jgi:hypothetical protein
LFQILTAIVEGFHFDWTITAGNIIAAVSFVVFSVLAWRDMNWRVKNLETWRNEHMIDSDSRDIIINRMDKILYLLTNGKEGSLGNNPKRR